MEIRQSRVINLTENILLDNHFFGIAGAESNSSKLANNYASRNGWGLSLYESHHNNVTGNHCFDNLDVGLGLRHANDTRVTGNNITSHDQAGIYLLNASHNLVHGNVFDDNGQYNAVCDRAPANTWDNGSTGNFWGNYTTRYPAAKPVPGANVWDSPYGIYNTTTQFDHYPLFFPPSGPPSHISIEGNAELTAFPYKYGSGTLLDPYIIAAFDLTGSGGTGRGISISNTTLPLVVRDCYASGFADGAYFYNITNLTLTSNNFTANSEIGVHLVNGSAILVSQNNCSANGETGIGVVSTQATGVSQNFLFDNPSRAWGC